MGRHRPRDADVPRDGEARFGRFGFKESPFADTGEIDLNPWPAADAPTMAGPAPWSREAADYWNEPSVHREPEPDASRSLEAQPPLESLPPLEAPAWAEAEAPTLLGHPSHYRRSRRTARRKRKAGVAVAFVAASALGVAGGAYYLVKSQIDACPQGKECATVAAPTSPDAAEPTVNEPGESPVDDSTPEPSPSGESTPDETGTAPEPGPPAPQPKPSKTGKPTPKPPPASPPLAPAKPVVTVSYTAQQYEEEQYYSALIKVTNDAATTLSTWTIRMPIGGQVAFVWNARFKQEGQTLVLTGDGPLGAGKSIQIGLEAEGESGDPQSCTIEGGTCSVD